MVKIFKLKISISFSQILVSLVGRISMTNTKSILIIIFVLVVISMLTSCASDQTPSIYWKGHSLSEMLTELGTPDKSVEYGGGKSHTYKYCDAHGELCCNHIFQVDSNDIIVNHVESDICF